MNAVSSLLADLRSGGSFAVKERLTAEDLNIEVTGVGPVPLPVTAATARELAAAGRPARFGLRGKTILDARVRDAWEIPKSRVRIDRRRWNRQLRPALERIRAGLGLPQDIRLRAELHNMLVYGPGQFFAPHQDSEKSDNMIASLVVTLPSRFTGGTLEVEHQGARLAARGSARKLNLLAFYADCHHQVRPVRSGHRVSLTYHLLLEPAARNATGPANEAASPGSDPALADAVREFLTTPPPPRWRTDDREPPERLVYLLDHQYSRRSLRWEGLKLDDAPRAAALARVADELDCEIFLAQADVHETWDCLVEGRSPFQAGPFEDDPLPDEDEDLDPFSAGPDAAGMPLTSLTDLIDEDIELRHWVAPSAGTRPPHGTSHVVDGELCVTRPSLECDAFRSEYEPFQGNWGNTVERWYHRAAVVLWFRQRGFLVRARMAPARALRELETGLDRGETARVEADLRSLEPVWDLLTRQDDTETLPAAAMRIAGRLQNRRIAEWLLAPLPLAALTPANAISLLNLLTVFGEPFCTRLIEQWMDSTRNRWTGRWIDQLPAIVATLADQSVKDGDQGSAAMRIARSLVRHQWEAYRTQELEPWCLPVREHSSDERKKLHNHMLDLLESSRLLEDTELEREVFDGIRNQLGGPDHIATLAELCVVPQRETRSRRAPIDLSALARPILTELQRLLEQPERAADDWRIQPPRNCDCELCTELAAFLGARDRREYSWPLAKSRRQHIHRQIDHHRLPVRHRTVRTGSPYSLVLTKTEELFKRDRARRKDWARARARLEERYGTGTQPPPR